MRETPLYTWISASASPDIVSFAPVAASCEVKMNGITVLAGRAPQSILIG